MSSPSALVVGGGLAGCEAAFQLASRGVAVTLVEQKPLRRTAAQTTDDLCELVCSNSLRGAALTNAVGLLKEEMRRAGSLVLAAADVAAVPAGGALAVDRAVFSAEITRRLDAHPLVTRSSAVVDAVPDASPERPVVLATGPLTGDALAADLARLVGERHLAYYDAIAPVVSADSIDWDRVFVQSRWGKGSTPGDGAVDGTEAGEGGGEPGADLDDEAYVNCPFDEAGYRAFVAAVLAAEKVEARAFEDVRYFEGCLPIEVMASRGEMTLAFGPMKPVGLCDPRTGRRPYAVVQLRPEDRAKTAYNLVGFQTRMTWGEQLRVLRTIPGLEQAEFLRMGTVHRNTFVNAPALLDATLGLVAKPGVYLAGQVTGVEGYVESAASGFVCGVTLAQRLLGHAPVLPPDTTALGAQLARLRVPHKDFQPSNVTWACFPPLDEASAMLTTAQGKRKKLPKAERYARLAARALDDLAGWLDAAPLAGAARQGAPGAPDRREAC